MLSRILFFIITATPTAIVFFKLGREQGKTEYKEKVKKAIEKSNSINNVKIRLGIK